MLRKRLLSTVQRELYPRNPHVDAWVKYILTQNTEFEYDSVMSWCVWSLKFSDYLCVKWKCAVCLQINKNYTLVWQKKKITVLICVTKTRPEDKKHNEKAIPVLSSRSKKPGRILTTKNELKQIL